MVTIHQVLEKELTAFLNAEPYTRMEERHGYQNGYKPRTLKTRVGRLDLMVPKDREGRFQIELFEKYWVAEIAAGIKPSPRGELEITDINNYYLKLGQLRVELLGRGFAWLDTGTHESLLEASTFIETIEKRQGQQVACLEEIAYLLGYIDAGQVYKLAEPLIMNSYGQYLMHIIEETL